MLFKNISRPQKTDAELIRLYQKSEDLSYLADLFNRYIHLVYGTSLKYLKDEDDSKDAVMEVFEKLTVTLQESDVKNFGSWLYVIVKNHCLMILRSQKRKETHLENMELSYSLHHNDETNIEEDLKALEIAMAQLPLEQNRCIDLFFLQQKCYKEISQITGYELIKVKSYIQNGKRNLKKIMEKSDE